MTYSILPNIYAQLASMIVSYVDKNGQDVQPGVKGLGEIPASVQTAQLPLRILLPIGQGQGGTANLEIMHSPNVKANWVITDLFLLETAAQDEGLYRQAPVLMRYVVAYSEALGPHFQILSGASVESFTISASVVPSMLEYPQGSGVWFYGVKCDLQVEEIF